MRRTALIAALLVACHSGAGAQDNAQRTAELYVECLKARAAQLDDRMSDARTIAGAIYQACIIECLRQRMDHCDCRSCLHRKASWRVSDVHSSPVYRRSRT